MDNRIVQLFLSLIRSGLWEKKNDSIHLFPANNNEWNDIILIGKRQTVSGLLERGISLLPKEFAPSDEQIWEITKRVISIEHCSKKNADIGEELIRRFKNFGLHPIILKGQAIAQYYSFPLKRESGDIDLYFFADEFDKANDILKRNGISTDLAADGSVVYQISGVTVEHHNKFYDLHCNTNYLMPSGTPGATILMVSSHILKHFISSGIGLRQFCDMAVLYKNLYGKYDNEKLLQQFKIAGVLKWNKTLCSFLYHYLGLERTFLPYQSKENPEYLLKRCLEDGNFGHGVSETGKNHQRHNKLITIGKFLKKSRFAIKYAPHEFFSYIIELTFGNIRSLFRKNNK